MTFVLAALLVPALAAAQQPVAAQTTIIKQDAPGGVGIGIKGGPIFSTFSQANVTFKNRSGLIGGLFFGGNRPGAVGVMAEVLYAKRATESNGVHTDLYSIEVPVLARINVGSSNKNKVVGYFVVGPGFDIKLKAKQGNLDVSSNFQALNLNLVIGAGVELNRFILEGRYDVGLRNMTQIHDAPDLKSKSFIIMLGFRFN